MNVYFHWIRYLQCCSSDVLQDIAIQCTVPYDGPPKPHHIIWLRNVRTICDLITKGHDSDYFDLGYVNAIDLRMRKVLKFPNEMLVVYTGSKIEQLTMDATCGYKQPDTDVMLIFKDKVGFLLCVNDATDPAYCRVEVSLLEVLLDSNLPALTHRWRDKVYLSAELFRERAMNIAIKNGGLDKTWSTIELRGPACKASLTDIGELDIIVCVAVRGAFHEMNLFKERKRESYWLDAIPLNLVCDLDGVLVPTCFRGCEGVKRMLTFRKSFSVQEIIIIKSLPHWCRQAAVVFKHTVLRHLPPIIHDTGNDPLICSYHLKTIFLWTVESMGADMWELACPARLLTELLKMLISVLEIGRLNNYWIPESNLLRYHTADYLADCCRAVKLVRDDIIAHVLGAPVNQLLTVGEEDKNTVKELFQKAGHWYLRNKLLPSLWHLTEISTWRMMTRILLMESSGSPQCLQQVGDMAFGLECLCRCMPGEKSDENRGFAMGLYIAGETLKEADSYEGNESVVNVSGDFRTCNCMISLKFAH